MSRLAREVCCKPIRAPFDPAHPQSVTSAGGRLRAFADSGLETTVRSILLGLLPMPCLGNLRRERTYLMSLIPGIGPHNDFGEHHVGDFRTTLLVNLRQDRDVVLPFPDPARSWHGGSAYWAARLRSIVACGQ